MMKPVMARCISMAAAWSIATVASAGIMLGLGELTIRSIHLLRDGIPFFASPDSGRIGPISLDQELGWKATEHYQETLVERTHAGRPYSVHRSQKQYGFRQFGDLESRKTRLLVIGDSFTHATSVSDDRTYHALLAQLLDVEVFAYGAGGYGTLQELMILDRYIDIVQPDVILWQYCANDFINNDNELERLSLVNNNGWVRPYLQEGQVRLLSPKESSLQVREWINRRSRFLYFIVSRIDRLRAVRTRDTVEVAIESEGMRHPGFLRAIEVTDELMQRVRKRVGNRSITAFNCVRAELYDQAFRDISSHHGIVYWDDIASVVSEAYRRGEDVYAADGGHWNERGHQLAAEAIAGHFRAEMKIGARPR